MIKKAITQQRYAKGVFARIIETRARKKASALKIKKQLRVAVERFFN